MNRKLHSRFVLVVIAVLLQMMGASNSFSQSRISSTVTKVSGNQTSGYGRDCWFAIPLNYSPTDRSTKYFTIYVNSLRNTTVHLQIGGGAIIEKSVVAGKVTTFSSYTSSQPSNDIPLSTEIFLSGVVEQKGVHVWSDDADIAVYFLSRRDYSSGGSYILPTIGWGKEYIVGAYESIFDPKGQADWPSEFAIVANQDNTTVTITPNWDLRSDGFSTTIEHPKKVPFTVNLNKGECVQYQTVLPVNDGECDVTGTIISSNNPVGVIGASVAPYLPFPNGFADYCVTMLQPVSSLSNSYFTAPFAGRIFGGDVYCVIATTKQIIFRNGVQVATLGFKGDHYFIQDETAPSPPALWTSDAPFELMQYIPSAKFGAPANGTTRNDGDADMLNINSTDQFKKSIFFQTPTIVSGPGQADFRNYVNIILPISHESKTTYDGILLSDGVNPPNVSKKERLPIPNTSWEAMRLTYVAGQGEGTHHALSDTGIGAYVYGYGSDESYSWNANMGTGAVGSTDTIPPIASVSGSCFVTHIVVSDSAISASKLNSILIDTLFNMSFIVDPNFIAGLGTNNSFYDLHVVDSTQDAYANVSIYDVAGNRTTVESIYKPELVKFTPAVVNFGSGNVGTPQFGYDTICNSGSVPFHFTSAGIVLTHGNKGFAIDSVGADGDIAIGGCRIIGIRFNPIIPTTAFDTIRILDDCFTITSSLIGNGGQPDFVITDEDFKCQPIPSITKRSDAILMNVSNITLTFDSIYLDDAVHFGYDATTPISNKLPFALIANSQRKMEFSFKPDSAGNFQTLAHFHSVEIGWKTANLIGCGQVNASVVKNEYPSFLSKESPSYILLSSQLDHGSELVLLPPMPNPATGLSAYVHFIYGLRSASPLDLSVYDILGNLIATVIHAEHQDAGIYETSLSLGAIMSPGSYIYRFAGAGKVLSGKLVVAR